MIPLKCIFFKWRFCQLRKWNKSSLVLWCLSEKLIVFLSNTVADLRTDLWELRIQWGERISKGRARVGWGRAVLDGLLGAAGCVHESQRAVSTWGGEGERRHWAAKIPTNTHSPSSVSVESWFCSGRQCLWIKESLLQILLQLGGHMTHSDLFGITGWESLGKGVRLHWNVSFSIFLFPISPFSCLECELDA